MESIQIDQNMLEKIKNLNLPEKKENNQYLLLHVHGDDIRVPKTFNAKVYTGKKGLKLVTNDYDTLMDLINNKQTQSNFSRTIFIDDSGWGFPLGGVLMGIYDTLTKKFSFREISVKFFQKEKFENKEYLKEYARQGIKEIEEINPDKEKTMIKICTGYVNTSLKDKLRKLGYNVEVTKIGEPLQTELEKKHKTYIKNFFGYDEYYDPKELKKSEIVSEFEKVIMFIKEKKKTSLAKTSWKYFKKR